VYVLPTKPASPWCYRMNWPTLLSAKRGSKYAYNDRMLFEDENTYPNLGFRHGRRGRATADKKALDLLKTHPMRRNWIRGIVPKNVVSSRRSVAGLLSAHLAIRSP